MQRPQNAKRRSETLQGKRKSTTRKTIVTSDENRRILALSPTKSGRRHDKKLADKAGIGMTLPPDVTAWVDTGFMGLQATHANIQIPKKRSKHHPLTTQDKENNRTISGIRVLSEHAICGMKRMRSASIPTAIREPIWTTLSCSITGSNYHLNMTTFKIMEIGKVQDYFINLLFRNRSMSFPVTSFSHLIVIPFHGIPPVRLLVIPSGMPPSLASIHNFWITLGCIPSAFGGWRTLLPTKFSLRSILCRDPGPLWSTRPLMEPCIRFLFVKSRQRHFLQTVSRDSALAFRLSCRTLPDRGLAPPNQRHARRTQKGAFSPFGNASVIANRSFLAALVGMSVTLPRGRAQPRTRGRLQRDCRRVGNKAAGLGGRPCHNKVCVRQVPWRTTPGSKPPLVRPWRRTLP